MRARLLSSRAGRAFWQGRLADSALATATAIGALTLADRSRHAARITAGLNWLRAHRNAGGGWGDTPESPSNLSTTALVLAALRLTGLEPDPATRRYVEGHGPLREAIPAAYGRDRTFSVPILTFCCLADLVDWADVPALPFELAALPQGTFRFLRLPVVSYALPALIAMGLVRHAHRPAGVRVLRRALTGPVLRRLAAIQPEGGGYLEAVPLTAFVAMSLLSAGRTDRAVSSGAEGVIARALAFLERTQRDGGAWPIDVDLSVWNTTMAVHALGGLDGPEGSRLRDWLLDRQMRTRHPYTGSGPGGWGWTDRSGSVPDADDTAGALLALRALPTDERCRPAAIRGVEWLLALQNRDGGWPTFCRGWGKLEFDRSGADLTAHALRALHAWQTDLPAPLGRRARRAGGRGLAFLARAQRSNGAWLPLWFGNPWTGDQSNPVFGTARVLLAYAELGLAGDAAARRGAEFLRGAQHADGGWGGQAGAPATLEETAAATEALARLHRADPLPAPDAAWMRATAWLCRRLEAGGADVPAPIGLYFARLWYHEALYPISLTVAALAAVREGESST